MPRPLVATVAGLAFLFAYVVGVLNLGDEVLRLHWALQAFFFVLAGVLWVPPMRWLMFWGAGRR